MCGKQATRLAVPGTKRSAAGLLGIVGAAHAVFDVVVDDEVGFFYVTE